MERAVDCEEQPKVCHRFSLLCIVYLIWIQSLEFIWFNLLLICAMIRYIYDRSNTLLNHIFNSHFSEWYKILLRRFRLVYPIWLHVENDVKNKGNQNLNSVLHPVLVTQKLQVCKHIRPVILIGDNFFGKKWRVFFENDENFPPAKILPDG